MNRLIALIIISLTIFIAACRVDPDPMDEEIPTGLQIELVCEPIRSVANENQSAVYVIIEENKVKIAELQNCSTVTMENFSNLQIPIEAVAAVSGDAESVYATMVGNKVIFFAGKKEFSQDGTMEYYPLVAYEKGKYYFKIPLNEEDLVGTYVAETEDRSWILFIGMRENGLEAQFFEHNGPLPDKKVMARLLPVMPVLDLKNLEIDLKDQRFRSELGPGFFYSSNDQLEIVFTDFDNHPSGRLRMTRIQ